MSDLVYSLRRPHRVGSVCGNPCSQCGGDVTFMSGLGPAHNIEPIPMYILREATYEEYVASVRSNGGGEALAPPSFYFYAVSVD